MATTEKAQRYVGGGVLRKEDPKLLTGQATYTDNVSFPGMVWAVLVRSPFAHARINSVDGKRASEMPGVVAVYSGTDLESEWEGPLPMVWPVTDDINNPPHWPIAKDKARFAGDAVAVVVAETRGQAKDAAEAVDVDYEPLEPVLDMEEALQDGAPLVHDESGTNKCYTWPLSNGEVDEVFSNAPIVVKERYVHPRLIPNAIEPRGVVVQPTPASGDFTMWSSTQIPHIARTTLSMGTGIPESRLRIIAPDVGGGFGSKLQVNAEEALCLVLARRLARPVKWIEERTENYLATHHGRGMIQDMEVAANEDGKVLGFRANILSDMGAYLMLITPGTPLLGAFLYAGPYSADAYSVEFTGVFTNKTPTDAYRGAGRPEATYAVERIMDSLARRVGKDVTEIRRMNFMPPFTEPTVNAGTLSFDSGNYEAGLDKALDLAGYDQLRKEQASRRDNKDVKQLGIGFSSYIEMCGLAPSQVLSALKYVAGGWDSASIRCHPTGKVTVLTGASGHGQGHDTTWSQIVADELGVPFEDIEVLHGDTTLVPHGMDTYGSRSVSVSAVALHYAAERVREKARKIAAHELEVAEEDIEWAEGQFQVKGAPDKAKTIAELAFSAWTAHDLPEGVEPVLEETYMWDPPNFTFPSGVHICVVEIDMETGKTEVVRYVAVDDCGTVINPMIVEGQLHGGITQGIAEALYEEAAYDENGTLLSSSMVTYAVPSAAEVPAYTLGFTSTPSTTNPLGVKGIGEAGTIAAPPAVINAVIDGLSHLGVTAIDMPATPERVWNAIQNATGGAK
jgi:carbon-monoxide dehydrogenase large subunit